MMNELLSLIKENPRLTNAELAAALDRDETQVAQQVRQYEADGVIKGYCAILDKEKAGDETVTALIEIKVQPKFGHGFDDIARRIAALEKYTAPDSACSACYGSLIYALNKLENEYGRLNLPDRICIGQGYRGKTGELGVGNCTCKFAQTVGGCPPTAGAICEFLSARMK